ncbi:hypothetical protein A3844_18510 [Paenibacillus helianthi]|uniref:Crp/Fnr family transcriptional regulator n=1 Tax=Paenibacillus helianthi TaxID=1349432 RepID=A0ABX3EK42_9BACL|nr:MULTISPECIES: cyclic nucleotide-binding domain-containing protein [Paenibacillus]OKP82479.1 hypothetical protein A3848_28045 [Paenibacillus sp. P32E]OKP84777.1 hypothetical protein A3844_18510 [Paenibacillus helianthi]OKP90242.1 hypothetical protein A3842_03760 [Paenibacillus sp. P3E]
MQWIADRDQVSALAGQNGLKDIFSSGAISGMELRRYSDGEAICSVGDHLEHLYILVQGRLKIHTLLPNGKSLLVRFARPMSLIGDVELLRQYPVKNEVVSVDESLLLVAGRELVLKEFEQNTVLLRYLVGELSHKMYTLGQTTALNLLYPLENRFASYLLSLFADSGGQRVEEIRTATLAETADLLGTSYRHLNRIVRRFVEEGIIERRKGSLSVLDQNKLALLANGNLYE